jgi:hypothetical protein
VTQPRGAVAWSEWPRALALFVLLTIALTWPLVLRLRIMDPGDSAFFAWVMAWERHALLTDPASLPHTNALSPARYTLGLDEPVLGTTLLGLPLWPFTNDAVLIYSLVRLVTYVLSALFTWRLARELGVGTPAALVAGALFAFSPVRVDQIAHLSTLGTQWLPLTALFVVRFAREGRAGQALLAGLFYALGCYACGYHGLLGALVWPPFAAVLMWGRWRLLARAVPALVLTPLLLWPLHALHAAALGPLIQVRSAAETAMYSARLESFLSVSSWNHVYGGLLSGFQSEANNLFPGLVPLLLILAATLTLTRDRRAPSRAALAFALLVAVGGLVALGPEIRVGDHVLATSPVALLRTLVAPLGSIRAYGRAGIFVALGLAVLAALAIEALRMRSRTVALVGVAALVESLIAPIPLADWAQVVDSSQPPPPVYLWLAQQPPGQVVAELPLLGNDSLTRRPAFHESIYMLRSTHHWQRLVNGFFGVETPAYVALREHLRTFPASDALETLNRYDVRYAVVHRDGYGPNQWPRVEAGLSEANRLRLVADFGTDRVYELVH